MVSSNKRTAKRARRLRRLRRLSALVGATCIVAAVAMLLTTSVTFDGHVEAINGQRDTNSVLVDLGLLFVGVGLLAFGLP